MREDVDAVTSLLWGVTLGLLIGAALHRVARRSFNAGRVFGAEEVSDMIAAFTRGTRAARRAPRVERSEGANGQ